MKRSSLRGSRTAGTLAAGLLTAALVGSAAAAPPPDPNLPRDRPNFPRERFPPQQLPGVPTPPAAPQIPAPPANGGQCVISISATNYRHTEIQRWEVTGAPTIPPGSTNKLYPVQWSTFGNGFSHSSVGSQSRDASWTVSANANVQYLSQVIASNGNRIVRQTVSAVRIQNGLTGTQQITISGVPQKPGALGSEAFEFDSGPLVGAANLPALDRTQQLTNVTGVGFEVPGGPGTTRNVNCSWHFVL